MQRRFTSPKLPGSKIILGNALGIGQVKGSARPVRKALIREASGKVFYAAAKQTPRTIDFSVSERRTHIHDAQIAWRAFKRAGLPVPSFSRSHLQKNKPTYLTVFMEDLEKKYGKLIDAHNSGHPEFMQELTLKKDSKFLKALATDLATINNLGFKSDYLDYWHLYKKSNGQFERVILDFNSFRKETNNLELARSLALNLKLIGRNLKEKEFQFFLEEVRKKLVPKNKNWEFITELLGFYLRKRPLLN